MNKNGKILNLIFFTDSKKRPNNNITNQEFVKKLSSSKQKVIDINFSDVGVKNLNFKDFKAKKEKSNNNSKIKQNKKNLITSVNETNEKEDNINGQTILKYQYYRLLSNNKNDNNKNNLRKKYIPDIKINNINSNIKNDEIINVDINKYNEFTKKKTINKKYVKKKEKSEKFYHKNFHKKINENSDNKEEIFFSSQLKNKIIKNEDLLSLFNKKNSNSINNKNKDNKDITNYISTNPNNKNEKNYIASFNRNFEKSCPKFNFNKYANYHNGQNNINIKKLNYEQINEDKDDYNSKNISINTIRKNISSNYTLLEPNNHIKNKINLNLEKNIKNFIKSAKGSEHNKNIIEFFIPNKIKSDSNNLKENTTNIQKIICRNNYKESDQTQKVTTQTNLINKKIDIKNINKIRGVRKIRTTYDKNNNNNTNKKDLTLNNIALKKKLQRYLDNEINSNIMDSTNILKKIKNKTTYSNIIRKVMNNTNNNNNNYYNNYMSNNNQYKDNSQRESKSVNIKKNESNKNIDKDKNKKNKLFKNEYYINKLITIIDNEENKKNYRQTSLSDTKNIFNTRKNSKENNMINNNEITDEKIIENISNNSLNTYSIFISHKYYKNIEKIALKKIKLFNITDIEIPVLFYRTNADYNNGRLFNTTMTNLELNKQNDLKDDTSKNTIPFLTQIHKDIYIYFYLNNKQSKNIKYIEIENYQNKNNKNISQVKEVEIYNGQNLVYKGILRDNINKIQMNITHTNSKNDIYKERPFSSSKTRKDIIIKNSILTKPEFSTFTKNKTNSKEIHYSARNNLFNKFNEHANIKEDDDNEYDSTSNKNENSKKNIINENNTINIHINSKTNNITNLEIFENNLKKETNNNDSHFFTIQNSDKTKTDNNLEKNLNQNLDMSFGKMNSDNIGNAYNELHTNINENIFENNYKIIPIIKEFNYSENIYNGNQLINSMNCSFPNNSLFNTNNTNISKTNYIQFNKIKFVFTSNYGHKKHIGLTGIEFYNMKDDLINIESAISIGALPKDLRTIYDDENDLRVFENIFNGFNNTDEIENMWVTKLKKTEPKSFIELYFKEKIKVSKLKFYNYNEKNNLEICARTIDLFLDDVFYNTIYLKPGIGEIAYDYINLKEEINNDLEDDYNNKNNDFGQIITFPINNIESNYILNDIDNNKNEIKYASFLYEQSYETPFMPCGNYLKFEFVSNYYKGIPIKDETELFKYKDLGLDSIEIYNNENQNIINTKGEYNYKIISNCEIFHNKYNKLILNGAQNKNGNNCLFYIFDTPISISYIKLNPLSKNMKSLMNSVKEIKIFCDTKIIFEGDLYIDHPTIILFTSDIKITNGINLNYLTKKVTMREVEEVKNNKYFSLLLD